MPDFSHYRRPSSGVPGTDASRKAFTYVLAGGVGVVGAHTAKNIVQDFLDTMSTSVRMWSQGKDAGMVANRTIDREPAVRATFRRQNLSRKGQNRRENRLCCSSPLVASPTRVVVRLFFL